MTVTKLQRHRVAPSSPYKRTNLSLGEGLLAAVMLVVIVAFVVALLLAIGAAVVLLAWNVGVVNIVKASGGHVSHIGIWAALGVSFAINIVRNLIHGTKVQVTK